MAINVGFLSGSDPSDGVGDTELLYFGEHVLDEVCAGLLPTAVHCSTTNGIPWQLTNQVSALSSYGLM